MNWIWLLLNDFKWDFIIYCFIYQLRVDMHPQSLPLAIASIQNICKNGAEKIQIPLKWNELTKWVSLHMHSALVFIRKRSKEIPCKENFQQRINKKKKNKASMKGFWIFFFVFLWLYGLWIKMNKYKIDDIALTFSSKQIKQVWKIITQCLWEYNQFKEQHMNRQRNLNMESKINSRII